MTNETGTITPGRFVWHELNTQDPERSERFYRELFGWTFDSEHGGYVHILASGQPVGGVLKAPSPHVPTHWLPYVSVEDVDEATDLARTAGCTALAGPMSIEAVGRFTVLSDPQHATFCVWRSVRGDPPEVVEPVLGSFCWDQLNTPDPDAAFAVYAKVFGWTRESFPGLSTMSVLLRGDRQAASMMQAPAGVPGHWLTYVLVDELAAARTRAQRLGGKVLVERIEVPKIGAFSVLQDDLGAVIAAFEAAPR